jgi:hypothetical protein
MHPMEERALREETLIAWSRRQSGRCDGVNRVRAGAASSMAAHMGEGRRRGIGVGGGAAQPHAAAAIRQQVATAHRQKSLQSSASLVAHPVRAAGSLPLRTRAGQRGGVHAA